MPVSPAAYGQLNLNLLIGLVYIRDVNFEPRFLMTQILQTSFYGKLWLR